MPTLNDAISLVESYAQEWSKLPKNTAYHWTSRGHKMVGLAAEVEGLWVNVVLVIGPRGGIHEEYIVLDPSRLVLADRLVALGIESGRNGLGKFVYLPDLRSAARQPGRDSNTVCTEAMNGLARQMAEQPQHWRRFAETVESTSESISALYGGLPGSARSSHGAKH